MGFSESIFNPEAVQQALGTASSHSETLRRLALARLRDHPTDVPSLAQLEGDSAALSSRGEAIPSAAWPALASAGILPLSTRVVEALTSSAGDATKLRVLLSDGRSVEAVIMRHDPRLGIYGGAQRQGEPRATLCVSSQVGCQMACAFCATGTMGLARSLTAGEIVEQLIHAARIEPIRNVVFMGMGEPLANYAAVCAAVRVMSEPLPLGLGVAQRRITVSTVGVVPRIRQLAADLPGVNLALSLHAPDQDLRERIVPTAKAYPLAGLLAAVDEHGALTGRPAFIEYVLLRGVNDGAEHARALGELLKERRSAVNLIPFNSVLGRSGAVPFQAPTPEAAEGFQRILRESYGINTTLRKTMGADIAGACGQLVIGKPGAKGVCGDVEDSY